MISLKTLEDARVVLAEFRSKIMNQVCKQCGKKPCKCKGC